MYKLLYIGKSNGRFTHNKIYFFYGMTTNQGSNEINIRVYYNNTQIVTFKDREYFEKNFKLITEHEHKQLIRKLKLEKINKHEGLF
jgi:hypothetical protein